MTTNPSTRLWCTWCPEASATTCPTDLDGLSVTCIDRNHKFPWSYVCRSLAGDKENDDDLYQEALLTAMRKFECWTCGAYTYRLKDTTIKNSDGSYQLLDAEHVFKDYQYSVNNQISLPET